MSVRSPSTSPTDAELVQRSQHGDRDAFRLLVERYQSKIAGLALSMLRSRDDALDVVQDAFTKAYQNLDRFQGNASFYTWVYRIAMNLCIDHQRREGRAVHVPIESPDRPEETISAPEDGPAPDEPFDRARSAEIAGRIREAVAELTPEHRAVILLREVEGLSYEEIAESLDCPKGTVMSRLHYARRQLQQKLGGLL